MADDVTRTHKSYQHRARQWQRCRDVFEGADAVKAKTIEYLPKLSGQSETEYAAYLHRAVFYGGFGRSVIGLTGVAFDTPPSIEAPDKLKTQLLADVTLAAEPFESFAFDAIQDVLIVGRRGILIDFSTTAARPYWADYTTENILDWDTITVDGQQILSWLVLRECQSTRDRFTVTDEERYRVLEIVPGQGAARLYQSTTYLKVQEAGKAVTYVPQPPVVPLRRGVPLTFIPFIFLGPVGISPDVMKPPLLDVVDLNLSHYRSSADLEHGRHFTALPTPVVTGAKVGGELRIGSSTAWILEDAGADAKYLEFTGQGLASLENALTSKERMMAILGSRLLENPKVAQEAAATVKMRYSGDNATLRSIVGSGSLGLTIALRWTAFWAGMTERVDDPAIKVELNTDFVGADVDLNALSLLAQADKISYETLYHNLEKAGLTRPGVTAQLEREQILSEGGSDPQLSPPPQPEPELDPLTGRPIAAQAHA